VVAALAIGGVLLLGMVAAAGYAIRTLPPWAAVPLHAGAPEHSVWLSRRAGLAAWLGIGAAAFAAVASVTTSGIAGNWSPSLRVVLLPSVMCVALAAEAAAIISARQRAAGAGGGAVAGAPGDAEIPAETGPGG
jgi:hypothetical protein